VLFNYHEDWIQSNTPQEKDSLYNSIASLRPLLGECLPIDFNLRVDRVDDRIDWGQSKCEPIGRGSGFLGWPIQAVRSVSLLPTFVFRV